MYTYRTPMWQVVQRCDPWKLTLTRTTSGPDANSRDSLDGVRESNRGLEKKKSLKQTPMDGSMPPPGAAQAAQAASRRCTPPAVIVLPWLVALSTKMLQLALGMGFGLEGGVGPSGHKDDGLPPRTAGQTADAHHPAITSASCKTSFN